MVKERCNFQISEFVGVGHPDKIADYISDLLLEESLKKDANSQFACEVLVSNELVVVAGESSFNGFFEDSSRKIIEEVLKSLGYDVEDFQIVINVNHQSSDIRRASIESPKGILSGDQSIVFGYATNETHCFMPMSYVISADLSRLFHLKTKSGELKGSKFDSKAMVILRDGEIEKIFISFQHEENVDLNIFSNDVYELIVKPVVSKYGLSIDRDRVFVNVGGKFVVGGLQADTGVTNRKLLVDSYGSLVRHGGGGYSGKDLTKVDRLGAYYARWICKNIVAAGLCDSIELQLVYFFGSPEPVHFLFNSESLRVSVEDLVSGVKKIFPVGFSEIYSLFNDPLIKYGELSRYGHFGTSGLNVPWEKLDKKDLLREYFGIVD